MDNLVIQGEGPQLCLLFLEAKEVDSRIVQATIQCQIVEVNLLLSSYYVLFLIFALSRNKKGNLQIDGNILKLFLPSVRGNTVRGTGNDS